MNIVKVKSQDDLLYLKRCAEASMGPARVFMHRADFASLLAYLVREGYGPEVGYDINTPYIAYRNTKFQTVQDWEQGYATLSHYGE